MKLNELIELYDQRTTKKFDEQDFRSELEKLIGKEGEESDFFLKAEYLAFDFVEIDNAASSSWGTYFGPKLVWKLDDGSILECPSINSINDGILNYWELRARTSINPILIARYSGLIWDFKKKITGKTPHFQYCELIIIASVDIANGDFHKHDYFTINKLKRAFELSKRLNDFKLINLVKDTILSYEVSHRNDEKPGLWGYSYDLLIDQKNKFLSNDEEDKIIIDLESKITRLLADETNNNQVNPWAIEAAAKRLAKYYRRKERIIDVKRVLGVVGNAFERIMNEAMPLQIAGWLEHLYNLFNDYGLKEEAMDILKRIRGQGPIAAESLRVETTKMEIPQDQLDVVISFINTGDLNTSINKIANFFIPSLQMVDEKIENLSQLHPLFFLIGHKLQDEKGRIIASVGPLEKDLDGHRALQISRDLKYSAIFLRKILEGLINDKGLNRDSIIDFISTTPIIEESRYEIISRGLDAYFQGDYLVFIHLLIPQIEEGIRNLVEKSGGQVLRPSPDKEGFNLKTLHNLLDSEILKEVLGQDCSDYLKILFTDQRGWNLRNSVCHGLASIETFNCNVADRILQTLLILGLIALKE